MILLDTAAFIWIVTGSERLSKRAREIYLNTKFKVYLSSVSVLEMIAKYKLGRLPLPSHPSKYIQNQRRIHGIKVLALKEKDVAELESLPNIHDDPFDRMLVCQARARNFTILTPDKLIKSYPVKVEW